MDHYDRAMAYPFPRHLKERARRLPGVGVVDNDRARQIVALAVHAPIAALAQLPLPRRTRFVIFGQGRSGSTLLVDLLDSHHDIYCDEELLHHRLRWPSAYVDGKSMLTRCPVYGYKVKPSQISKDQGLDIREFLESQVERGWHILHLQRSSIVRQTLSGLVARERSSYHRTGDGRPDPVMVPAETLFDRLEGRLAYRELEAAAIRNIDVLALDYDRDLADSAQHEATASAVFEWLGLPPHRVESRLRRVSSTDWRSDVLNADEVLQVGAARGHGQLLTAEGIT